MEKNKNKINMLKVIAILTIILSTLWLIQSNFQYEPMIVLASGIAGLISIEISNKSKLKIKGNRNKVLQVSEKNKINQSTVEGNDNQVTQL